MDRCTARSLIVSGFLIAVTGGVSMSAAQQGFYLIEPPVTQPRTSYVVKGLSSDGLVAAITSYTGTVSRGGAWSASEGLRFMQVGPSTEFFATSISDDHSLVGGPWVYEDSEVIISGIYATPPGQVIVPQYTSSTLRIGIAWMSGNGLMIAGDAWQPSGYQAYQWSAGSGLRYLDHLTTNPSESTSVFGISSDGSVIAGSADSDAFGVAVWWNQEGRVRLLPWMSDFGFAFTTAVGVSRNGQFICGNHSGRTLGYVPVIWPLTGGIRELERPVGFVSAFAYAVSDDGQVAAGYGELIEGAPQLYRGLVWPSASYAVDGATYFAQNGAAVPDRWLVWQINAISADGTVMAGTARNIDTFTYAGFVAYLQPPCIADFNDDGGVDGSDIEAFFLQWEDGLPEADVDHSGGVDGQDVEAFFRVWESGGCQ